MLPPDLGVGGLVLSGVVALLAGVAVEGLAVGSDHTCVLLDDGSVKCFGLNDYGQLGQGDKADRGASASDMGDSLLAVDFGTRSPAVVAMSAGSDHTCVIFFGGSMKCFGRNNKGQLGHGNRYDRGDDALEMGDNLETVDLGDNRTAVAVAAEGDRTCALLDTGDVRCWGDGEHGALGTGDEKHTGDGKRDIADSVDLGVGTSAITAIGSGPCAITEDGVMKVDDVLYWTCSGSPMGRTTTSHPRRSRQRTHIANTLNISARFVVVSL